MSDNCIHKQPNASMCYICGRDNHAGLGMDFYDDGESTVKSIVTPADHFQGYPGVLHGGVVAAILDEVVGRSTMSTDHHRFMMTVNMTVQYRHPVPIGQELIAIGKVVRLNGRLGKAEGQIILADGTVACEAQLTLANMPAELADEARLGALDWRVDPD
jgi:uncharacterized protein (TIGR00369 family)